MSEHLYQVAITRRLLPALIAITALSITGCGATGQEERSGATTGQDSEESEELELPGLPLPDASATQGEKPSSPRRIVERYLRMSDIEEAFERQGISMMATITPSNDTRGDCLLGGVGSGVAMLKIDREPLDLPIPAHLMVPELGPDGFMLPDIGPEGFVGEGLTPYWSARGWTFHLWVFGDSQNPIYAPALRELAIVINTNISQENEPDD